jgi:hypothetical protein
VQLAALLRGRVPRLLWRRARAAVVDGLNALLEAERAGARVLAILRDSVDARSPLHDLLGALQKDEGANAVQLYQTLRRLGGAASTRPAPSSARPWPSTAWCRACAL